jgi:hypothetical protein
MSLSFRCRSADSGLPARSVGSSAIVEGSRQKLRHYGHYPVSDMHALTLMQLGALDGRLSTIEKFELDKSVGAGTAETHLAHDAIGQVHEQRPLRLVETSRLVIDDANRTDDGGLGPFSYSERRARVKLKRTLSGRCERVVAEAPVFRGIGNDHTLLAAAYDGVAAERGLEVGGVLTEPYLGEEGLLLPADDRHHRDFALEDGNGQPGEPVQGLLVVLVRLLQAQPPDGAQPPVEGVRSLLGSGQESVGLVELAYPLALRDVVEREVGVGGGWGRVGPGLEEAGVHRVGEDAGDDRFDGGAGLGGFVASHGALCWGSASDG